MRETGTNIHPDYQLLYQTFREAIADWMMENKTRFVLPPREHWPEDVESINDAQTHYSTDAVEEIIPTWEEKYRRALNAEGESAGTPGDSDV